jgi:hypothetical protein
LPFPLGRLGSTAGIGFDVEPPGSGIGVVVAGLVVGAGVVGPGAGSDSEVPGAGLRFGAVFAEHPTSMIADISKTVMSI